MLTHIPIHNLSSYSLASLTNLTLGSFFIASHIYQNWLRRFNLSLLDTNAIIKGMLVTFGCILLKPKTIFSADIYFQFIYLLCGCTIGLGYYKFETWILKKFPHYHMPSAEIAPRKTNNIKNCLNKKVSISAHKSNYESYLSGGLVAAFEEILFRGFLTIICLGMTNIFISIGCLILVSIIFALSHINLGYQHVVTKLVLGSICFFSFLLCGDVTASIGTHITFNILAIKKRRNL